MPGAWHGGGAGRGAGGDLRPKRSPSLSSSSSSGARRRGAPREGRGTGRRGPGAGAGPPRGSIGRGGPRRAPPRLTALSPIASPWACCKLLQQLLSVRGRCGLVIWVVACTADHAGRGVGTGGSTGDPAPARRCRPVAGVDGRAAPQTNHKSVPVPKRRERKPAGVIPEGGQRGRVRPASGKGARKTRRQGVPREDVRTGPGTWLSPRSPPPSPRLFTLRNHSTELRRQAGDDEEVFPPNSSSAGGLGGTLRDLCYLESRPRSVPPFPGFSNPPRTPFPFVQLVAGRLLVWRQKLPPRVTLSSCFCSKVISWGLHHQTDWRAAAPCSA